MKNELGTSLRSSFLESADKITGRDSIQSVIEFAESYRGLDLKLYPAQRVILKMTWGEPLSDSLEENTIEVRDDFNDKILHTYTEQGWLDYLYGNKQCNFNCDMYLENCKQGRRYGEIDLPIGRRGSKTVMMAVNAGYLLYKLYDLNETENQDFFEYFGLIKNLPLYMTFVSNNKTNSAKPYEMIRLFIKGSDFLSKYIYSEDDNNIVMLSPISLEQQDEDTYLEGERTLVITHAVPSASLRGDTNIFVSLDEYCFLRDAHAPGKVKYLDEQVYDALVPSTATVLAPDGTPWGMAMVLSSINGKQNNMYKLYKSSFGDRNTLMFHLRSFDVNKNFDKETLYSKYRKSKVSYAIEYLSNFDVTSDSWLEDEWENFQACMNINPNRRKHNAGAIGTTYYVGIDQGFIFDPTVIAIGHNQPSPSSDFVPMNQKAYDAKPPKAVVVLDLLIILKPEEGEILDPKLVAKEINTVCKLFHVKQGIYDQYSKATFESLLDEYGLVSSGRLEVFNASQVSNDMLANLTKEYISSNRLEMSYDEELETEFSGLQETYRGGLVKVENADPEVHDDRYDAISRMIYLCSLESELQADFSKFKSSSVKEARGSGNTTSLSERGGKSFTRGASVTRKIGRVKRR